jgi:hypothetical protein
MGEKKKKKKKKRKQETLRLRYASSYLPRNGLIWAIAPSPLASNRHLNDVQDDIPFVKREEDGGIHPKEQKKNRS